MNELLLFPALHRIHQLPGCYHISHVVYYEQEIGS